MRVIPPLAIVKNIGRLHCTLAYVIKNAPSVATATLSALSNSQISRLEAIQRRALSRCFQAVRQTVCGFWIVRGAGQSTPRQAAQRDWRDPYGCSADVPPLTNARPRPARTPIQKSPPAAESAALPPFHLAASSRLSCKSFPIFAVAFTNGARDRCLAHF